MFQLIFTNSGLSHVTEKILLELDPISFLRCKSVNKRLCNFIKSFEKSPRSEKYHLRIKTKIRFKKFLVHKYWNDAHDNICQENDPQKISELSKILINYYQQEPFENDIFDHFNTPIESSFVVSVYGSLERLKFFWPYLADKNPTYGIYNKTPLHFIAMHGLTEVVDFMMNSLEDHNPADSHSLTPLHQAARNGHLKIVQLISTKVDHRDLRLVSIYQGYTPLHFAVENGHFDCVEALVQILGSGRWISVKSQGCNPGNETAMDIARRKEYFKIVNFLESITPNHS